MDGRAAWVVVDASHDIEQLRRAYIEAHLEHCRILKEAEAAEGIAAEKWNRWFDAREAAVKKLLAARQAYVDEVKE